MREIAGVDGVPDGWVVVRLTGRRVRWSVVPDAAAVVAETAACAAVGIDIPLGLPSRTASRPCDVLVAGLLGRARSSVFPAPPRAVLAAPSHAEACVIARELTGRAISIQSYTIGPKILDWDAVDPLPSNLVEVHPELALRRLAPDVEFTSKKTARGAGQRIAALARWVDVAAALADLPPGARLDDCLDALAAAWSAARWADGAAQEVGREVDERGRIMRVVV